MVERMTRYASSVAGAFVKKDGLYFGLEKLVIQRRRCGGGRRSRLLLGPQGGGLYEEQTRHDEHTGQRGLYSVHKNLRGNNLVWKITKAFSA
jgi:hypothetical protein